MRQHSGSKARDTRDVRQARSVFAIIRGKRHAAARPTNERARELTHVGQ